MWKRKEHKEVSQNIYLISYKLLYSVRHVFFTVFYNLVPRARACVSHILCHMEMELLSSLFAGNGSFAPKPTRLSFHLQWRISLCRDQHCSFIVLLRDDNAGYNSAQSRLSNGVDFIRWLFEYAFVMNLCSLVLDHFIVVVKPFKYLT